MKQNKIIAITGGIGSGKSTVIDIIKENGYKVISADEVYKELIKDSSFVKEVYTGLGLEYLGKPFDSALISSIVFNNKEKLKILDTITHPHIMKNMFLESGEGVVFHEVPLLLESKLDKYYNSIIIVRRDIEKRIDSVIQRSNLTRVEVISRINNQVDYDSIDYSKYIVIDNNGTIEQLKQNVQNILEEF